MGTWSTKINGNDTFQDIYQSFFDLYNQGESPTDISKKIQEDFSEMFEDYGIVNNIPEYVKNIRLGDFIKGMQILLHKIPQG